MGMNIGFHCVYPSLMQRGFFMRIFGQKIIVPLSSSVPTKTPFSTCEKSKQRSTPNSSATASGIKSSPPSVEDDTSCVPLPFTTQVLNGSGPESPRRFTFYLQVSSASTVYNAKFTGE